jgi:hypothetical protein
MAWFHSAEPVRAAPPRRSPASAADSGSGSIPGRGSRPVQEEFLQRLIELADDLFFGNSHVALKSFNHRIGCRGYRIGQLRLATSWRTFHQQWLAHTGCQIHHLERDWIDDVACRTQLRGEFACRREHVGFLSS